MHKKDKETTTFGVSSKRLARLFATGSEQDQSESVTDDTERMGELLRDYLREPMPITSADAPDQRTSESSLRRTIDALSGEPIGRLLCDPKTDIALIRRIKDYGRKLSTSAKSKPEHQVANTIYYLAIASGLVRTGTRITTHTFPSLATSFSTLGHEGWIPKSLTSLFAEAASICHGRHTP